MQILTRATAGRLVALLMVLLALHPARVFAQEDDARLQLNEQSIKAGLVYNFLKYTTWPDGSSPNGKSLRVCLFGHDPHSSYLSPLGGQTAQQSKITLVRKDKIDDTADCNMVFVDAAHKGALPDLLAFLKDRHILTMSDMNSFASMGGMVELTVEDKRVVLYINDKSVNKAGLNIQSRLLRLAKIVSG